MTLKHHRMTPPWKRPSRVIWFVFSLCAACWLTVNMPPSSSMRSTTPSSSNTVVTEREVIIADGNEQTHQLEQNNAVDEKEQQDQVNNESPVAEKPKKQVSAWDALLTKAEYFARLFCMVGFAAFLGGLMETRHWHLLLAKVMGKLTRMARLPDIVGLAMPTALFSNAAANSILVNSHAEGQIRTSALIAGGMANSYLAYVSHSLRVMYPVVAAIGLPGILYFTVQFSGGLLVILGVMCWNRWRVGEPHPTSVANMPEFNRQPDPWSTALKKSTIRALTLLFRMICITVPLMVGVEWLLKNGTFDFWEQYVPAQVSRFFPPELISVVVAQMGGLIQSSAVSANLREVGLIDNAQILLVMLIGSAVGNPIRTLRRNLPSAMAIFPPKVACIIVFGMQFSRFATTLLSSCGVIAFMHFVLYAE